MKPLFLTTHIGFKSEGRYHRFKKKHLILVHSNGKINYYYIHQPHSDMKVKLVANSHKLENIYDYVNDTFFDIRQGWIFNLNYYFSHDSDRMIQTILEQKADLLPELIVARDRVQAFKTALGF